MIDIGGNIGWYPTYLGTFKYTIITFEPYSKNYYVLKKIIVEMIEIFLEINLV